jgi:hypothetical protein
MMGSRFEDRRNTKKRVKKAAAVVGPVAVFVTTAVVTVVATIVVAKFSSYQVGRYTISCEAEQLQDS